MSTDKAMVTEPVAYIVTEALAELRKHKDASAAVWSGLNASHPFNKDATPLYAHPPAKREAGETAPPDTPAPSSHLRVTEAADAYVVEQGIEHSGGIIERAFEAGALWSMERAKAVRWRMFEDTTPGYWGIELEDAGNDDDAILYPQKIHRDTVARIVEAHNAALATTEGSDNG